MPRKKRGRKEGRKGKEKKKKQGKKFVAFRKWLGEKKRRGATTICLRSSPYTAGRKKKWGGEEGGGKGETGE